MSCSVFILEYRKMCVNGCERKEALERCQIQENGTIIETIGMTEEAEDLIEEELEGKFVSFV